MEAPAPPAAPSAVQATYEDYTRVLGAGSFEEACGHVTRLYGRAFKRFEEAVTDLFVLGAALSRAQVLSSRGSAFLASVAAVSGVREDVLRRALGLYRAFGGSLQAFVEWKAGWIERHDVLLLRHVDDLIAVNRERASISESVDRYNAHIEENPRLLTYAQPARFEDVAVRVPFREPRADRRKAPATPEEERRSARARAFADLRGLAERAFTEPVVEGEIDLPGGRRARVTIEVL